MSVERAALLCLIVLKLGLLIACGPSSEPDWGSYSAFADIILGHTTPDTANWLSDAGLDREAVPLTIFRSIGFPLIVAAFRFLLGAGPLHLYAIVVAQMALSVLATVVLWRLARTLLKSRGLALLAAAGHATATTLLYDQSLLSDSLYNNLFILGWAVPLLGLLEGRAPRPAVLFGLGLALGVSCLDRGTGLLFSILILPQTALWLWRRRPAPGFVVGTALFLLPATALVGGDMAWNHARTGHWIMTTGAQYVMIQPLIKAAGRGHDMFDGETPIDIVAREELKTFHYDEIFRIVDRLFTDYHLDAIASAELHKQVYLAAWKRHPGAMLENAFHNYNNSIFLQFLNPPESIVSYWHIVGGKRLFLGFGKSWAALRQGDLGQGVWLVAALLFNALSYLLFAALTAGGVLLARRLWRARRWPDPHEATVLWLWTIFFVYTLTLCAIHMVGRFVPAASPAGLIASLVLAQSLITTLRTART